MSPHHLCSSVSALHVLTPSACLILYTQRWQKGRNSHCELLFRQPDRLFFFLMQADRLISKTGYCFLWLHSMLYVLCLWPPCIMTGLGACSTAANRTGSIRSECWLCNSLVMPAGGAERVDRFNVNKNHNAIRQKNRNVSA